MASKMNEYRLTFTVEKHEEPLTKAQAIGRCRDRSPNSVMEGACDAILIGMRTDRNDEDFELTFAHADGSNDAKDGRRIWPLSVHDRFLMFVKMAEDLAKDKDLCDGRKLLCRRVLEMTKQAIRVEQKLLDDGIIEEKSCPFCVTMHAATEIMNGLIKGVSEEEHSCSSIKKQTVKAGG